MKKKPPKLAEKGRVRKGRYGSNASYGNNGFFIIKYKKVELMVMVSDQEGWDHVSVSTEHRIPSWNEMNFIKDLFFEDHETVVQFHPKKTEYVNTNPHVLHLWRKQGREYELPPNIFV